MLKANNFYPYALPSQTYSAGGRTTQTLRDLPKVLFGKLCHLVKVQYSIVLTPTFTTAPTVVGDNNIFEACDFWDGSFMRFQGGFNHLRQRERMQSGRLRYGDANTATTSTNSRWFKRVMHVGPPQCAGGLIDYAIPTGALENGELRFTHGPLTDISADTTAATGTVRVVAWLALLDEIRIGPAYQYVNQVLTAGDANLAGRALYESIGFVTDTTFAAFTNGQIGNMRLDLGNGDIIPSIKCNDLQAGFVDDFNPGMLEVPHGDPEGTADSSTDVRINRAAQPPTALTSSANDLQPLWWTPMGGRITKMPLAESVCRVRWDGSLTPVTALIGRILPQPSTVIAAYIGKALGRLNLKNKGAKFKTLSKKQYSGPYAEFMPVKVSV